MSRVNFGFADSNLKVDYLSLNLQFNSFEQIEQIANLLADTINCRSTLLDQSSNKQSVLTENSKNRYSAEFVINSSKHWEGTILRFRGKHAQWFYNNLKLKKLDWSGFDLEFINLGRFDLCYDRKLKEDDKDLNLFFENSYKRISSKKDNRSAKIGNNILRVGKRSSSNFFRIYLKSNGRELRFEIELKKTLVKRFQHYLFTYQFKTFEELLTAHFYHQALQLLDLKSSYSDWLVANFRRVKRPPLQEVLTNSLSISYLAGKYTNDLTKIEFFYRFIQLLNYLKYLKGSSQLISMGDQDYKTFQFPVNHFLEFIGKPKNNHYQIRKLVEFLKHLQKIEPILENFSDGGFRSYAVFPYLKVERKKSWCVELSVCKELYLYQYPFHLPENFLNYQNNFELKVKFILLQSFCNVSIDKEFPTQEFLGQVSMSDSKSAKLKNCIVTCLHELKDFKVIEPKFQILTKQNQLKEVTNLTSNLVSRSKLILYKENINNNYNYCSNISDLKP